MPAHRLHYAWVIAALTFLILLVAAGMRAAPAVLLIALQADFGWTAASISLGVGINLLLYGLFGPFAVAVMDRYGMRRTLIASLALIAAGTGLTSVMTAVWQFVLLWGLIAGLGSGVISMVLAATVAARWFTARRGLVIGALSASAAAGALVLLPLMTWLERAGGWRVMVLVIAGAVAAVLPLVAWLMHDRPSDLALAPYGDEGGVQPAPPVQGNPVANALRGLTDGLRNRDFLLMASSFFICGATTNGLIGTHFLPACLDFGIPATTGAGLQAVIGVFTVTGALASGWLSDRFDARVLLAAYYISRGLALFCLPFSFDTSVGLSLFAILYGLDWIATAPPTVKLAATCFGKERAGLMYGWVNAIHQIGSALAAFAGGVLRDHLGSYILAFFLAGIACLTAAIMATLIGRGRRIDAALAT